MNQSNQKKTAPQAQKNTPAAAQQATRAVTVHQTALQRLKEPAMYEAIKSVLPSGMSVERFIAIASAEIKSPGLKKVDDANSILVAIFQSAKMGLSLNPQMGEGYLVPFNVKQPNGTWKFIAQFIPGYQGLAKLVRQAENNGVSVLDIKGFCVHDTDKFDYCIDGENGLKVFFQQNYTDKPNRIIASFSMAKFSNGYVSYHVVPWYKLEEIKEKALKKTKGYGPWKDNEDEMAIKTAIRHHTKTLPKSERVAFAVGQDEIFEGKPLSSEIPEELVNTGLIDEGEYTEIIEGANAEETDKSTKPDTEEPKPKNVQSPAEDKSKNAGEKNENSSSDPEKDKFLNQLFDIAISKGCEKEIDSICFAEFSYNANELPKDEWQKVIDHFSKLPEQK